MADILYKWRRFNPKTESYETTETYYVEEWQEVSKMKNVEETYYESGKTVTDSGYHDRDTAEGKADYYRSQGYAVSGPYRVDGGTYYITYTPRYERTRTVPKVVWERELVEVPKTRTVTKQRTVKGTQRGTR